MQMLLAKPKVFAGVLTDIFSINVVFSIQGESSATSSSSSSASSPAQGFLLLNGAITAEEFVLHLMLALSVDNNTTKEDIESFLFTEVVASAGVGDDDGDEDAEDNVDDFNHGGGGEDHDGDEGGGDDEVRSDENGASESRKKRRKNGGDDDCGEYEIYCDGDKFYPTLLFEDNVASHACAHVSDPILRMLSFTPRLVA